jgi:predicted Ser/Thr protein kinase
VTEGPPQAVRAELDEWLRRAMSAAHGTELGMGYQGAVHLYASPVGDVVVKQPHQGRWLSPLWRYLLRREAAVYARLAGIAGIPRSYGLLDGRYLLLEHVPGPSYRGAQTQLHDRERFFALLLETLRAMHAAGVAHGDLKRKDNVIVGPDERPYLIDFGIATRHNAAGGPLGRWWFAHVRQGDLNAWIKLKYGRRVEPAEAATLLSAADAALYKPLWMERIARAIRVPWQKVTLRRPRQRWRRWREQRALDKGSGSDDRGRGA